MKMHSTNYYDTLIEVSEDTTATRGKKPPSRENKTIAEMQYDLISKSPYKFTSDDILFQVFADRTDLTKAAYKQARELFFSKGQPCFRASPLTKSYGFGVHSNSDGKVAIYGMETEQYQKLLNDSSTQKIKAMRNTRKPK